MDRGAWAGTGSMGLQSGGQPPLPKPDSLPTMVTSISGGLYHFKSIALISLVESGPNRIKRGVI